MTAPWLTIATVVRDDEPGLAATLESLRAEDLTGVEILVVDSSSDEGYAPRLTSDIGRCVWVTPQGIFPAMNSALEHATGTYVYYLNAGDLLQHDGALTELKSAVDGGSPTWLFAPVEIVSTRGDAVITPSWDYAEEKKHLFARGLFPPHQGTVARTDALRQAGGFDSRYKVAADYAAFLRLAQMADPLILTTVLAKFFEGGASTVEWKRSFREFHEARRAILQPSGWASLREYLDSALHFAKVFAYREVALRARR